MAHEQDSIKKLFRIVYRAYKYMPESLKPKIDRGGGSRYEFFFPDINSRIYCDLESRSDTIHKLHVSEIGLMKNDEKVRATLDAVPIKGGEVTYESTPKGLNHFYRMWKNKNRSEKKYFFPWYMFDEYRLEATKFELTEDEKELIKKAHKLYDVSITVEQIAFRRFKINQKGGGKRGLYAFMEEYPEDDETCFVTSGEAVMDLMIVKELISKCTLPIKTIGPEGDQIKVWKNFDRTKSYVCGADPAEGVDGDWSVGIIVENETKEAVATCRGQWRPYDFANKLNDMCLLYTRPNGYAPLLGVERNNHGHAVLLQLESNLHYPNLYKDKNDGRVGWITNKVSRSIMISDVITAIENKIIIIRDEDFLSECLNLENINGKIEAAEGYNDDCIFATSIAVQLSLRFDLSDLYKDLRKKIR